jgi:hypothetical protein
MNNAVLMERSCRAGCISSSYFRGSLFRSQRSTLFTEVSHGLIQPPLVKAVIVYLKLGVGVLLVSSSSNKLSCDKSTASSKLSSPKSAIPSFLLQLPVSSCFLQVIQQLLTSPSSPCCSSNLSFSDEF